MLKQFAKNKLSVSFGFYAQKSSGVSQKLKNVASLVRFNVFKEITHQICRFLLLKLVESFFIDNKSFFQLKWVVQDT